MPIRPYIPALPPKLALVGEAPGAAEELQNEPFVGESGQELTRMMRDAGLLRTPCFLTNVFDERPGTTAWRLWDLLVEKPNDLSHICAGARECKAEEAHYALPPISPGKYVRPAVARPALARLKAELESARPNLVVALGNSAIWALCGQTAISKLRGTVLASTLVPGLKVLPTYHPAGVLRQWEWRVIVVADLIKAKFEMEFPEIVRPSREIWTEPTVEDIYTFGERYIYPSSGPLSTDVETKKGQITALGFAPTVDRALVIPFVDNRHIDKSYWRTLEEEVQVWKWVQALMRRRPKLLGQNFMYDVQYFLFHGILPRDISEDSMLEHHALYPEMPKDLGFLGSIYTSEPAWKMMRPRGNKVEKDDE